VGTGDNVEADSSGNFFFITNDFEIGKLDPISNTVTIWSLSGFGDIRNLFLDTSGNLYFHDGATKTVNVLNPDTNTVTSWNISTHGNPLDITSDSSGTIYFPIAGTEFKEYIGRLVISTNTLTAWQLPTEFSRAENIVVDSNGLVFFSLTNGPDFGRLVPSTNTITEWSTGIGILLLELDPLDKIFFRTLGVVKVGFIT